MIPGLAQWVKDLTLPQATAALIQPLAWERPYAAGAALKRKKKKKKRITKIARNNIGKQ